LSRKLAEVAQCWRALGHEVKLICGGDIGVSGNAPDGGTYGSQEIYTRWYKRSPVMQPLVTSISEWRDIRHDRLVLQHIETVDREWLPDIIWERSCRLHCVGLTAARCLGVPYVLEWKDHLVDDRVSLFRRKALRMEVTKNHGADYIVVESKVLRDDLERQGIAGGKIIVAHNAVKVSQFARDQEKRVRVRSELGVDGSTVLVGYLGSYAFYHDTARLVLAADIIRRAGRAGRIKVLMMGAGREYPASRKLAERLGLEDSVLIMKPGVPTQQVPGILAALDIAILPGSTEIICPIKVQEYMACELPTLVPDYACNREVIDDGRTGVLFAPRDAHALAAKICDLADEPCVRLQMGREARREVERRFGWESTWGAALNEVIYRLGR
jgi:glycosyltransferase involved in cell wall biosynthesis